MRRREAKKLSKGQELAQERTLKLLKIYNDLKTQEEAREIATR